MNQLQKDMDILYRRYYKDVLQYCLSMNGNNIALAEDITQNTFYKAIVKANSFRGDCQIRTWLFRIARNDYISFLRKDKHINRSEAVQYALEHAEDLDAAPHIKMENKESLDEILQALNTLEEPYGEVFRLKIILNKDYKEIADLYGKTQSWARVTYYRAKQKIIEQISN